MASLRLSHKHAFDVDRVSSLIDTDQRHTVDFRNQSGSVAMLAQCPKHVPNNISHITQLCALFEGCIYEDKSVSISVVFFIKVFGRALGERTVAGMSLERPCCGRGDLRSAR